MNENNEIILKERIRNLLRNKKATITSLAENGTLIARYFRQINDDSVSVPYSTIVLLLDKFPDVSAEWLVMGRGEMIRQDAVTHNELHQASNNHGTIQIGNHNSINSDTEALKARIRELENDKQLLQGLLAAFTKK